MNNYTIVIDTSFNVSKEEIQKYNLDVIAIHAYINDKELNVDINEQEFYKEFFEATFADVKTAAPSRGQILDRINSAKSKNENVIVLTTSSKLSSTYANTCSVAQDFENVHIIDSKGAFAKNRIIFNYLVENLNSDLPIMKVIENAEQIREQTSLMFIINDLKYLQKNGRIGKAAGIIGEMFSIKPILGVDDDGGICTLAKVRSEKKAIDKMLEFVSNAKKVKEVYLATLDEKNLFDMFVEKFNKLEHDITLNYSQLMPAVVGVHSGPKVFIIGFLEQFNTVYDK